ncbi:mechanosensitive ion channel family protein [Luteimonas vadosa]|uniref:Mechanosensitive ion channel n=1 Tax=Luteimonas vadosa TaxID=1165507 RepID=A0ABP9DSZ9_9GAMM
MLQENIGESLDKAGDSLERAGERGVEGVQSLLEQQLLTVSGVEITVGGVVFAAIALLLTWGISVLARRAIKRYGGNNKKANQAALYTVSRIVHYSLLVVGLLIALSLLGFPASKFAVFAGAIGVGLGFGLQAIFSNFISGLILLFDKSLKVGDFVELESGVHGEVRDIKIRATTIVTNDNIDILVPNSEFVTGRVVNWTHRDISRRLRVPFGVAYGSDKELVKRAGLEAACEVPFTLSKEGPRKPQVWLSEFGDSSLNFELVVWLTPDATKRPSAVTAAYNWAIHSALQKYDIEIPFPQQDVHVRSLFGLSEAAALHALKLDVEAIDRTAAERKAGAGESSNDAVEDVQRGIEADAARAAEEASAARRAAGKGGKQAE